MNEYLIHCYIIFKTTIKFEICRQLSVMLKVAIRATLVMLLNLHLKWEFISIYGH